MQELKIQEIVWLLSFLRVLHLPEFAPLCFSFCNCSCLIPTLFFVSPCLSEHEFLILFVFFRCSYSSPDDDADDVDAC